MIAYDLPKKIISRFTFHDLHCFFRVITAYYSRSLPNTSTDFTQSTSAFVPMPCFPCNFKRKNIPLNETIVAIELDKGHPVEIPPVRLPVIEDISINLWRIIAHHLSQKEMYYLSRCCVYLSKLRLIAQLSHQVISQIAKHLDIVSYRKFRNTCINMRKLPARFQGICLPPKVIQTIASQLWPLDTLNLRATSSFHSRKFRKPLPVHVLPCEMWIRICDSLAYTAQSRLRQTNRYLGYGIPKTTIEFELYRDLIQRSVFYNYADPPFLLHYSRITEAEFRQVVEYFDAPQARKIIEFGMLSAEIQQIVLSELLAKHDVTNLQSPENPRGSLQSMIMLFLEYPYIDGSRALWRACACNDVSVVERCVTHPLFDTSCNQHEALCIAVSSRSLHVLTILLKVKSIDPFWGGELSVMTYAIQTGDSEVLSILLANRTISDMECLKSAINIAITYMNAGAVSILLAIPEMERLVEYFPEFLSRSIEKGQDQMALHFLNFAAYDPSINDNSLIREACRDGQLDTVKVLLKCDRIDPGCVSDYPIRIASLNGDSAMVTLLLKDLRVDPSALNNQAIIQACEKGCVSVLELLLNDGRIDPTCYNNLPFRSACLNGHIQVARLLLNDSRVDPTDMNNLGFRGASENGYVDVVNMLLEDKRVDPASHDQHALNAACQEGHLQVILALMGDDRIDPSFHQFMAARAAIDNKQGHALKLLLNDPRFDRKQLESEYGSMDILIEKMISESECEIDPFR